MVRSTKWRVWLGTGLTLCALVAGCARYRVASDLVEYVNLDILGIAEVETQALAAYAAVVGDNYTTDEAVLTALRERTVPQYTRFFSLLRDIQPDTEEIRRIHALYVQGAGLMLEGFRLKWAGLERGRFDLVLDGNHKIESGRRETEQWREALEAAYGTYKVHKKKNPD